MMKKVLIIILIFLISIFIFFYSKKDADTKSNKDIAFYYEENVGNYVEGADDQWKSGEYALNVQNSICDGEKNPNYLSWNNDDNTIILKRNKDIKCSLYFDKKKKFTLLSVFPIDQADRNLTNMVKNGDYENGSANWSNSNCVITSEKYTHGKNSLKFNAGNFIAMSSQSLDKTAPTINHSYYGSLMFLSSANFTTGDSRYEWWVEDAVGGAVRFLFKNIKTTEWTRMSGVFTLTADNYLSRSWILRNFQVNTNNVSYTDELIMVDLTESYGNNIPTKEDLDNTLIYFDDTVYMKSIMGLQGEFKVSGISDNQEIECNNDGVANVSNGVVTITGNSPYVTCYLKNG